MEEGVLHIEYLGIFSQKRIFVQNDATSGWNMKVT